MESKNIATRANSSTPEEAISQPIIIQNPQITIIENVFICDNSKESYLNTKGLNTTGLNSHGNQKQLDNPSNIPLYSEYLEEKKALFDYVDRHIKHGPAQKSAAWYAIKNVTIGGSEVATVLGLNKYKTVGALVAEKSLKNFNTFRGNTATRWGNLFEFITKTWTEKVLGMPDKILEFGSVEGIINRQRYSPDGIGLVLLKDTSGNLTWFKVLFEFKAPYIKIPNGYVPEHYYPQIQTGLLTFPILDIAIFVNNCYRKCKLADLGFNPIYDTITHKDNKDIELANPDRSIYACGIVFFYQRLEDYLRNTGNDESDDEEELLTSLEEVLKFNNKFKKFSQDKLDIIADPDPDKKAIDFGAVNEKTLNVLFELLEEGQVFAEYSSIVINEKVAAEMPLIKYHECKIAKPSETSAKPKQKLIREYNNFLDICDQKGHKIVGYLPWKLLKSDMLIHGLEDGWQQKIEPKIKEVLKQIDTIIAQPTEDEKYKKYCEFYPQKPQKANIDIGKISNLFEGLE